MKEGQIQTDWKDDDYGTSCSKNEYRQKDKNDAGCTIAAIIASCISFAVLSIGLIVLGIRNTKRMPEESSYSIPEDPKHKVALIIIDGRMVEYECSWAMSLSNGSVTIKLKDGTELETSINNVFLFEYDGDECESLNEIRDKFM